MIWILTNVWWLATLGIVALACLHPAGWALLRRVPVRWWLVLAAAALLGLSFQAGRWYERTQQRTAQETAEGRADAKAAKIAGRAATKAQEARTTIRKETSDVQVQIREVVRTVPGDCPAMPDELRDLLQRQVEAARAELPAGASHRDRGRAD